MSDIVERLRLRIKPDYELCEEAADEIERLREQDNAWITTVRKQEEELVRQRAAKPLEQIRQVCADNAGEASNHKMALDFVHQIAIRALKEQP